MTSIQPVTNVTKPERADGQLYECPCCGEQSLYDRGGDEICSICKWEDDGQDDHDADRVRGGPNYMLSLTAAGKLWKETGKVF